MLCTSGLVDDVTFSYNGVNGPVTKMMRVFCRVHQVAPPTAKLLCTIAGLFSQ